jgi:hypothetical protein
MRRSINVQIVFNTVRSKYKLSESEFNNFDKRRVLTLYDCKSRLYMIVFQFYYYYSKVR